MRSGGRRYLMRSPDAVQHERLRSGASLIRGLARFEKAGPRLCPSTRPSPRKRGEGEESHNRLAADVDRLLDFQQHADAGLGAGVGLLARQELGEDRLAHRPRVVQFDLAEETQEATLQHAVAL